jgi:Tfp pilus assembly protein PilV
MLALLVFSTAMTGALAVQVQTMRASSAALQRSIAVLLVQDILARIRSNPLEVERYTGNGFGDSRQTQPDPPRDCERTGCGLVELATFDLWHWESLLLGATSRSGDSTRGALHLPRACISHRGGRVTVHLSWRAAGAGEGASQGDCVLQDANLYDDPSRPPGNNGWRSMLLVSTRVERPA